jgi:hypothetical protein
MSETEIGFFRVLDDERVVAFEGWLLGAASSERSDKDRWFELSIYRTNAGAYIVSGVGKTRVPNEVDLAWCKILDRAEDVIRALQRTDGEGELRLTNVARRALDQAADNDPDFATISVA